MRNRVGKSVKKNKNVSKHKTGALFRTFTFLKVLDLDLIFRIDFRTSVFFSKLLNSKRALKA